MIASHQPIATSRTVRTQSGITTPNANAKAVEFVPTPEGITVSAGDIDELSNFDLTIYATQSGQIYFNVRDTVTTLIIWQGMVEVLVYETAEPPLTCGDTFMYVNPYGGVDTIQLYGRNQKAIGKLDVVPTVGVRQNISGYAPYLQMTMTGYSGLIRVGSQIKELATAPRVWLMEKKECYTQNQNRIQPWQYERTYAGTNYVLTEAILNTDSVVFKKLGDDWLEYELEFTLPTPPSQSL